MSKQSRNRKSKIEMKINMALIGAWVQTSSPSFLRFRKNTRSTPYFDFRFTISTLFGHALRPFFFCLQQKRPGKPAFAKREKNKPDRFSPDPPNPVSSRENNACTVGRANRVHDTFPRFKTVFGLSPDKAITVLNRDLRGGLIYNRTPVQGR